MSFRVLIAGSLHFTDYPLLRATLNALLANRLPDVELLTTGGPGVSMLVASYAKEVGIAVTPMLPEFGRFPEAAAIERRDGQILALADAAVIVSDYRNATVRRLHELVKAKGIPVHVVGEKTEGKVKKVKEDAEPERQRGMLPD